MSTGRMSFSSAFLRRRTTATLKSNVTSVCFMSIADDNFAEILMSDVAMAALRQFRTAVKPERSAPTAVGPCVMAAWVATDHRLLRFRRSTLPMGSQLIDSVTKLRATITTEQGSSSQGPWPPHGQGPRLETYVVANEAVDASSHDSTSINLGLAADSVAQADYDMASLPVELIGDETTVVRAAYRNGNRIGRGLFAARDIGEGEIVACYGQGGYIVDGKWEAYCAERGLDHTWSGFGTTRCLPAPTKAMANVKLYDTTWTDISARPKWSYLNHDANPNCCTIVPSRGACEVQWKALWPIRKGEELTFHYGGETDDYEEEPQRARSRSATRQQQQRMLRHPPPSPPGSPPPFQAGTRSLCATIMDEVADVARDWVAWLQRPLSVAAPEPPPSPSAPGSPLARNTANHSPVSIDAIAAAGENCPPVCAIRLAHAVMAFDLALAPSAVRWEPRHLGAPAMRFSASTLDSSCQLFMWRWRAWLCTERPRWRVAPSYGR